MGRCREEANRLEKMELVVRDARNEEVEWERRKQVGGKERREWDGKGQCSGL